LEQLKIFKQSPSSADYPVGIETQLSKLKNELVKNLG